MNLEDFNKVIEESFERSRKVLSEKNKKRTSVDGDRLGNFKTNKNKLPTETLVAMVEKHIADFNLMASRPYVFTLAEWYETTVDLRNYTILMEALLQDMGIKDPIVEDDCILCKGITAEQAKNLGWSDHCLACLRSFK